ncbi:MAG: glycosyltransferase family 4 protein [Solirubrobacterales bacterium]|nr:glycosyltransferase family 4 protein [Solirubrobacterales bacterium]
MRLAYLTSRYPGTSEVFVQREVRGLRARGVEIDTVSVRRSDQIRSAADREEAERTAWLVPAAPLALLRAFARAARGPGALIGTLAGALRDAPGGRRRMQVFYWGEAVLLWDLLRRRGIGHVHVHFANNASDIALLAVRLGRARGEGPQSFSLHLHGPTDFFDVERNRIGLKVSEASGVLCISDYARGQVLAHAPADAAPRIHVARYGAPSPIARGARPEGGPLRILNVGRLAAVKGHEVLLEALAAAVAAGADATLDVVGDGPLRADLERRTRELGLGDRVRWHGALGSDALLEHWATADVFCLPSFAEGLPVVLLEAMAAGLPVVATAITGVPEAVRHDREGLLVAPARPDLIAEALVRLAGDPALRARLGAAGAQRAAGELSQERSLDQIEAALRKAVRA